MMNLSLLLSTAAVLTVSAAAFVPQQQSAWTAPRTTLFQASGGATNNELMKKCGAGLAFVPVGNKQLFDPELEGKLQGTHDIDERIRQGVSYQPPNLSAAAATSASVVVPDANVPLKDTQHWLEDIGIPSAFAKASAPVTATILGRTKIIGDSAPGDIEHVVMQLPPGMHYVEGQSLSVIPPGVQANGKPNKPRLYSIASTRYGDLLDGSTVSLCVRRAEFTDPETGELDSEKAGVCSKFLCDCVAGDTVDVAGPVGKTMLLPEDPSADVIMVATGTGIAPFRAFLQRLFMEQTVARHVYTGDAWLILGVPVTAGLLYQDEIQAMQENAVAEGSATLTVDYAISREMKNQAGGKLYVQDALQNKADILWDKLDGGAHIYFCGLKGMMPGILTALEQVATARGVDWTTKLKELQANKQWHVEVY
jgi:ferredoxin--NADP+ reductase